MVKYLGFFLDVHYLIDVFIHFLIPDAYWYGGTKIDFSLILQNNFITINVHQI